MKINQEYVNAMLEIRSNEILYSNQDNLPTIFKEFISIAKNNGLDLKVEYCIHKNTVGYKLQINGKADFIQDVLIEKSIEGSDEYSEGIDWFKKSLKETFGI